MPVLLALRDRELAVRMAAVYALDRCPRLWALAAPLLPALLDDPSVDVCRWLIRLAGTLGQPACVAPLIAGLELDARESRGANFAVLPRAEGDHRPGVPTRSAVARGAVPLWRAHPPDPLGRRRSLAGMARRVLAPCRV